MKTPSTARVDVRKNRIYLTMIGFHDVAEATRVGELYLAAMKQCTPGFSVLVDVAAYKPGAPAIEPIHARVARAAREAGVGRVARVVGDSPLGGMQIDRIVRSENHYAARHFPTVAEAEAYLDDDEVGR